MDPQDPSQRPSIFSNPDPDDEPRAAQRDPGPRLPPPTYAPRPYEPEADGPTARSRRLMLALGGGGLLLLLIGGFVAASILRSDDDPSQTAASPTPEATATSVPSPTATLPSTPSASPTPSPTPAGPPQDVALGSWAMVAVDELNVRAGAGTDSTSNYLLVRGAVVHVAEGPVIAEGLNWYRVASLGGAVGWVTSGWVAEPFLTPLVEDPILIRCGEVRRPVFDIVNGMPVPHDPLAIGDLALPAAAFGERALAAIEMLRGVGQEGCITAQLNAAGVPIVTSQLNANACGRAVRDGAFFRLRPATGQDVPPEVQVKDPLVLHPSVLTSVMVDDPMSTNLRTIADLIAAGADATGCFTVTVQGEAGSAKESTSAGTDGCFIVSDQIDDVLTLARSDGGASTRLRLTPGAQSFPIGAPLSLYLSFGGSDGGSYGYVYQGYREGCA